MSIMKRKLCLILFSIGIICILVFICTIYRCDAEERLAQEGAARHCLALSIINILNEYHKNNGYYPEENIANAAILKSGYPEKVSCGFASTKDKTGPLYAEGRELRYEYRSPQSVNFSFPLENKSITTYKLKDGKIVLREINQ